MQTGNKPSLLPAWLSAAHAAVSRAAESGHGMWLAVACELPCNDLLRVARASTAYPQVGWADTRETWLGLGSVDELVAAGAHDALSLPDLCQDRLNERLVSEPALEGLVRYFGGIAFDPSSAPHPAWPSGLPARFVLPGWILRQAPGSHSVQAIALCPIDPRASVPEVLERLEARRSELEAWIAASETLPAGTLHARRLGDPSAPERWSKAIEQALAASDTFEKIVLSREIHLGSLEPLDPWVLFGRFDSTARGHRYIFRFEPEAAFIGATPERLVAFDAGEVRADSLAGTIRRGSTAEEDAELSERLLESEKDRREHAFVVRAVQAALSPCCDVLLVPEVPVILATPTVQHLHTPVSGQLREGVRMEEVLSGLYPTPAVCGTPREAARVAIRELEDRPRGWYAGAVGWIGASAADFAVGIRSAIVHAGCAVVIAGAGILAGSDPEAEWDETERKASGLLRLLEA